MVFLSRIRRKWYFNSISGSYKNSRNLIRISFDFDFLLIFLKIATMFVCRFVSFSIIFYMFEFVQNSCMIYLPKNGYVREWQCAVLKFKFNKIFLSWFSFSSNSCMKTRKLKFFLRLIESAKTISCVGKNSKKLDCCQEFYKSQITSVQRTWQKWGNISFM